VDVLASYSIKGGVGKTSTAVNLAALAAGEGRRTLIWDLDPQGAATFLFRVRPKVKGGGAKLVRGRRDPLTVVKATDIVGLDLLPADFSYRHLDLALDKAKRPQAGVEGILAPLAGEYDLAILDCPPSISLVSESVFAASDMLLVPLIPSTLSVRTFEQLRAFLARNSPPAPALLAFLSMVDRRRGLHRELASTLPATLPEAAAASIPIASAVEQMGVRRAPLVTSHPRNPAARAYAALWAEAAERLTATRQPQRTS
jgi:chromosome partitioning protein